MIPTLPPDFTHADLAAWLNAVMVFNAFAAVIVVVCFAILVFRGK